MVDKTDQKKDDWERRRDGRNDDGNGEERRGMKREEGKRKIEIRNMGRIRGVGDDCKGR